MGRILNMYRKDMLLGVKDTFILLEIAFAVVIMLMLLFVFPKDIKQEPVVYIWDNAGILEPLTEMADMEEPGLGHFAGSREEVVAGMVENKTAMGLIISEGEKTPFHTELLVQPYTSEAMIKNIETEMEDLLSVLPSSRGNYPPDVYKHVRVTSLKEGLRDELPFNRRLLPPLLLMMVGILGLFAMVSLISQERLDATIRAYRVSPAGLGNFILSKHLMLLTVSIVTFSILYIPVMGGFRGYLPALLIILLTVIMGSCTGIILGAFFDSAMASIGWVFLLMIVFSLPAISLFAPVFSPPWLKFIPSYHTLFGLDAAMFPDGNRHIIWQSAAVLAALDILLYAVSARLFRNKQRKEA